MSYRAFIKSIIRVQLKNYPNQKLTQEIIENLFNQNEEELYQTIQYETEEKQEFICNEALLFHEHVNVQAKLFHEEALKTKKALARTLPNSTFNPNHYIENEIQRLIDLLKSMGKNIAEVLDYEFVFDISSDRDSLADQIILAYLNTILDEWYSIKSADFKSTKKHYVAYWLYLDTALYHFLRVALATKEDGINIKSIIKSYSTARTDTDLDNIIRYFFILRYYRPFSKLATARLRLIGNDDVTRIKMFPTNKYLVLLEQLQKCVKYIKTLLLRKIHEEKHHVRIKPSMIILCQQTLAESSDSITAPSQLKIDKGKDVETDDYTDTSYDETQDGSFSESKRASFHFPTSDNIVHCDSISTDLYDLEKVMMDYETEIQSQIRLEEGKKKDEINQERLVILKEWTQAALHQKLFEIETMLDEIEAVNDPKKLPIIKLSTFDKYHFEIIFSFQETDPRAIIGPISDSDVPIDLSTLSDYVSKSVSFSLQKEPSTPPSPRGALLQTVRKEGVLFSPTSIFPCESDIEVMALDKQPDDTMVRFPAEYVSSSSSEHILRSDSEITTPRTSGTPRTARTPDQQGSFIGSDTSGSNSPARKKGSYIIGSSSSTPRSKPSSSERSPRKAKKGLEIDIVQESGSQPQRSPRFFGLMDKSSVKKGKKPKEEKLIRATSTTSIRKDIPLIDLNPIYTKKDKFNNVKLKRTKSTSSLSKITSLEHGQAETEVTESERLKLSGSNPSPRSYQSFFETSESSTSSSSSSSKGKEKGKDNKKEKAKDKEKKGVFHKLKKFMH